MTYLTAWINPHGNRNRLLGSASVAQHARKVYDLLSYRFLKKALEGAYFKFAPSESDFMPEQFLLIPGRTSKQGTTLNEGKYTNGYLEETSTLQVAPEDMARLELSEGDLVRIWNEVGEVTVPIKPSKGNELPSGMLFISYGDKSCRLMDSETHGTGMPDSKGMDVFMERV